MTCEAIKAPKEDDNEEDLLNNHTKKYFGKYEIERGAYWGIFINKLLAKNLLLIR